MKNPFSKTRLISLLSILILLGLWKFASIIYNSELILPSPESTIITTFKLMLSKNFVKIIMSTILRGMLGFTISFILGVSSGIFAGINPFIEAFIKPVLISLRSIPVISLILLALIWFRIDLVAIFIAFLTMFPFICTNVIDGIKSVDQDLIVMSKIHKVESLKIIKEVYLPAITPFIFSGSSSALGFGWRAVIIGEVLSQPKFGIGTLMQTAQTYLLVNEVIAWTIIAVFISYLFEWAIRKIEKAIVIWK